MARGGTGRTMLVFWKARLVLLAVPKTGSTALEAAFGPGRTRRS
jgi:ubiquinone/menaquinone biosynthesis C-methylase UbiE